MFQANFLICILLMICLVSSVLAGHDVMVHLAIYNDGPFKTEKVPAVFGVPFPASEDPFDPNNLILAGAEPFQIRTLSTWPNGSVRWLMVEAIVNVQPTADRAAVHLTTGQRPAESQDIAREIPNGFLFNTGKCVFRLEDLGQKILCKIESVEEENLPEFSILLSNESERPGKHGSRKLLLENNGPASATVAIIETFEFNGVPLEFSRRCRVFKGQKGMSISSTFTRLRAASGNPILTSPLNVSDLFTLQTTHEEHWNIEPSDEEQSKRFTCESTPHKILMILKHPGLQNFTELDVMKNIFTRERIEVVVSDSENNDDTNLPFIGVAVSPNTYNDSQNLAHYVSKGEVGEIHDLSSSTIKVSRLAGYLYSLMGREVVPSPSIMITMDHWISDSISSFSSRQPIEGYNRLDDHRFQEAGLFSTWYFLTGDEALKRARLAWAAHEPLVRVPIAEVSFEQWDAFLLDGALERRDAIVSNLGTWMDDVLYGKLLKPVGISTFQLVSNITRQGGLERTRQDEWLDRFEKFVHRFRISSPNDILFAEGYRLTGEREFLRDGRVWLDKHSDAVPDNNAISGLLDNFQRQYVWRWLPLTVGDHDDDGIVLKWKVPRNLVRYRLKTAQKPITNIPAIQSSDQAIAFCESNDLEIDIPFFASGTEQTLHIPKLQLGANSFVAMRYLERGPELPAPTNQALLDTSSSPSSSAQKTFATIRNYYWLVFILMACGMIFILKRKRS